ncbi:mucin-13b [Melanotaenia boesemani]|uniref:mucin-13b n=1 Tax=Melanotaenia boesemani TaxID=1250792 RepID=UPI001C03CD95|nr:mucin-13b [Melanotaenia boesemani]
MAKTLTLLVVLWIAAAFVAPSATSDGSDGGGDGSVTEPPAAATTTAAPETPSSPATTTAATETPSSPAATTKDPDTSSDPEATTKDPDTSSDTGATTKDPDTSSDPEATTKDPVPPTTESPNPCIPNPCGGGSTCEPRADEDFVCLCLPGDSYDSTAKTCNKAKVFPGQLQLSEVLYSDDLKDKTSKEFKVASDKIITALETGFKKDETYTGSTVLEFREAQSRSTRNTKAEASVQIFFQASSDITQDKLKEIINTVKGSTFTASDLCESKACDEASTICKSEDGSFTCNCNEGYIKTGYTDRICRACPGGMKFQGSECVNCPFGYSGFNCGENWKLVLVIVGSVLGGLLLITLIVLPVVALKSPKKSSKKSKNEDIGKPYVSHSPAKTPLVNSSFVSRPAASVNGQANGPAGNIGAPRIPRATPNNNWDNRNNMEMTSNLAPGRNTRLNDEPDDMYSYSQSRPQSNPYAQSRPQSNPYSQNRAHVNPYAERQGHSNPYYTHDDGKRF